MNDFQTGRRDGGWKEREQRGRRLDGQCRTRSPASRRGRLPCIGETALRARCVASGQGGSAGETHFERRSVKASGGKSSQAQGCKRVSCSLSKETPFPVWNIPAGQQRAGGTRAAHTGEAPADLSTPAVRGARGPDEQRTP